MEYDAGTNSILLFYFDSSGDISEKTKAQLMTIASDVFLPMLNTTLRPQINLHNISREAVFQGSNVNDNNCVPYVSHYLAEFLNCKKGNIQGRHLRESTESGLQMRLNLTYNLRDLFDLHSAIEGDEQVCFILNKLEYMLGLSQFRCYAAKKIFFSTFLNKNGAYYLVKIKRMSQKYVAELFNVNLKRVLRIIRHFDETNCY
jgi:hypothetical protein